MNLGWSLGSPLCHVRNVTTSDHVTRENHAVGEHPMTTPGSNAQLATSPSRRDVVRGLVLATHFGPTLAVTSATTVLAIVAGRGAGAVSVAGAVLAGQCAVGWSNDALDAPRDRSVGRINKPVVAGLVTPEQLFVGAAVAFLVCIPLSLVSGWRAALVHLIAVASAYQYNKRFKLGIWSPLPYALSFGLLPAFVTLGLPAHTWPRPLVMVVTALIGVGAHFINAVVDIDDDRRTGVRGLPQRCGARWSLNIGTLALLAAAWLTTTLSVRRTASLAMAIVVTLLDIAVIVAGLRGHRRLAWRLAIVGAVGCLAIYVIGGHSLVAT